MIPPESSADLRLGLIGPSPPIMHWGQQSGPGQSVADLLPCREATSVFSARGSYPANQVKCG